ncbi:MAG: polysaccharide biosynthesis tyrosine autokinase [Pyrinomonadaceae bacterium]|nr:polysaccharide biosynthesis tyrosine autokinase [Pyrinomonadaceae bacterium]
MSQDNRLMPLSSESLDRPLRDLAYSAPAPATAAPAHQSAEIHLRDYVAVVMKRKWLILSLAVVVTSLVAIQMYRLPSIYEAKTTIQIEQRNKSVLQSRDLIINAPSDPAYWSTQLKLIENPELARQVILTLDLQNNPAFLGGQSRSFLSALRRAFRSERPAPLMDSGVPVLSEGELDFGEKLSVEQLERLEPYEDTLRANLVVDPTEKTSLVDIRYQHPNPEIAMRVADALAAVFILRDNMRETQGMTKAAEALAREIADLQTKIRENEAARLSYMIGSNLPLNAGKGQDLNAERLGMLSSQLLTAENELKNFTAAFKAAQTTMDTKDIWSIPEVVESKSVQRLRDKISDLEERRSALMVQYTAEWPEVKKVDEQIARLKQDLDKTPREIVNSIRARYEASIDKVNKLRQEYSRELADSNQMSIAEMGMSHLNQQLETNKQFYNTLYQKQKELQITSSDRSNNVSVATPARLPRSPVGPQRGRNILIAFILSLGAGVGLAFLLDYLDDTLNSVEDVDRHIQLPTLALIPAPRAERLTLRGKPALATKGAANEATALALIEDVRSPVAEAYRHLRTSLLLSTAGQPPKTMLVTSSQPSEGKTTTAVNTAMMLAQTGAEVLIVDCDLRRPRIHAHFALPNTRGVTNYLSGESNLDELIQICDKVPNLKVLTSGRIPPSAAELLGSGEMQRLLHELSGRFNHIVIDSPPTISFTDASILSTLVDGVILVVHGGRSSRGVVRRAKQQLHDVGAHIFGIVLNNVKAESSDYYYNNYYSGYYADEEEAETAAEGAGAERGGAS